MSIAVRIIRWASKLVLVVTPLLLVGAPLPPVRR